MAPMQVCLVTLGDPQTLTGGYLYHRRMAELAPDHDASVTFHSFPTWPFPLPVVAGKRMLGAVDQADVVVIDSIVAWGAAPWLARVKSPVAGMLHQGPGGVESGTIRRSLQAPLDRMAYRHMARIFVAGQALGDRLEGTVSPDRIVFVPPGRDVAVPGRDLGDIRDGRRIAALSIGNWAPHKGTVELLTALAALPPDLVTLHLVGRTDVDASYAARVERLLAPLDDRVVVHGPLAREEVASLYEATDVFVLPSFIETYGTVYAEAMAMGLPVVGWRAGNLPNLAEDGVNGLIVEPGDVDALGRALRTVAEDDELRRRLGTAARERAQRFPTWDETAERFFGELRALANL